jgi:hypothetical protein
MKKFRRFNAATVSWESRDREVFVRYHRDFATSSYGNVLLPSRAPLIVSAQVPL